MSTRGAGTRPEVRNSRPRVTEARHANAFILLSCPFHNVLGANARTNLPSRRWDALRGFAPILELPILDDECPLSV